MVKERRYVFDISDIDAILYTCKECGQEVSCLPDGLFLPGKMCVSCGSPLAPDVPGGIHPARTLLTNLRMLMKSAEPDPTVRVSFVVREPCEDK